MSNGDGISTEPTHVAEEDKQREGELTAKHWPFVESPDQFAARLAACSNGPGGLLAGVRTVLIEQPPVIADEYLRRAGVKILHRFK